MPSVGDSTRTRPLSRTRPSTSTGCGASAAAERRAAARGHRRRTSARAVGGRGRTSARSCGLVLKTRGAAASPPARRRASAVSCLQLLGRPARTRPPPRGAPRRSTSRAGCRGTGAAAPSSTAGRAARTGRRSPARAARPSSPTARPRAAGARCAGCPAWCGPGRCRWRGAAPGTARRPRPGRPGTRLAGLGEEVVGVLDVDLRRALQVGAAGGRAPASRGWGRRRRRRSRRGPASACRAPLSW